MTTRLNAARNAIGDSGEEQRLIKTLPRKGVRFIGTVRETPAAVGSAVIANSDEQRIRSAGDSVGAGAIVQHGPDTRTHNGVSMLTSPSAPRLSIVVLPFANLGGDPEQDYFVEGVTESLTTDLSRIGNLFVISRNSAVSYKGKEIDVRQVGRELNVRYVLEGSVQRNGNRLRVNVQLIDAENGKHLWAERFEKSLGDLFDVQDEIVSRLANTLHIQLVRAEARRAKRSPHPDAKDLNFQGVACLYKGWTPEYVTQARELFRTCLWQSIIRSVAAMVGIAHVDLVAGICLLTDDPNAVRFRQPKRM